MLRYLTGGESHGKSMLAILDGMPAGLSVDKGMLDKELVRRMAGYGRGKRMGIEADKVAILSGIRKNKTLGSPISIEIRNIDHSLDNLPVVLAPRPGHADLAGALKYDFKDVRNVLERSSARETVSRVAVGALCKILLAEFGVRIISHVIAIGRVESASEGLPFNRVAAMAESSDVRCVDPVAAERMHEEIDGAMKDGDTLGGIFEVIIHGAPPGLGSYTQWDRKLDGLLARGIMSIQAVKGVSFGIGFEAARRRGSIVHDEIFYSKKKGYFRVTNNAGGVEGGMTNGEDIIISAVMKPIPTLRRSLSSVNISTKKAARASVERSDACAVPSAGVIAESVAAFEIANALVEKVGGDSVQEMRRNYAGYLKQIKKS